MQANKDGKRKRAREIVGGSVRLPRQALTCNAVLASVGTAHFRATIVDDAVFTFPLPKLQTLAQTLAAPVMEANQNPANQFGMELDVEEDDQTLLNTVVDDSGEPERAFFRVVKKNPSRQKVLGGKKFGANCIAISQARGVFVAGRPNTGVDLDLGAPDAAKLSVFSFDKCNMKALRASLETHDEQDSLQYHFPEFDPVVSGADQTQLTTMIDKFMLAGAMPDTDKSFEIPDGEEAGLVEALDTFGYIEMIGDNKWRMTKHGLSEVRLNSMVGLGRAAMQVREHVLDLHQIACDRIR